MATPSNILVVDDEQVVIDAIAKACCDEDLTVDGALDVHTAFSKLEKKTYELAVCDIMMPEIDGFQFLEQVVARNIALPVIMTTGYSTVEHAVKSLRSGAVDFIPKPFTVDELLSPIRRALRLRQLESASPDTPEQSSPFSGIRCPAGYSRLGYTSWVCIEPTGAGLIGVTDLFLRATGPVSHLELSNFDEEILQGSSCAKIFAKDTYVHDVLAPMSGRIIERNEALIPEGRMLEESPFVKGWLYRIIPSDSSYELGSLTECPHKSS